ncbi:MAG: MATE family efflux transporter [Aureispira sp.]
MEQTTALASTKLHKAILWLAIPNILSNISAPLLSSVDTGLMGMLSTLHIGAVGLGAMLFNFLYWNLSFLRMGTTGLTAQAFGRADQQTIAYTLFRALILSILLGLLLLCLRTPLLQLGIHLMNVPTEQVELVSNYFSIRLLAAPATLLLMVLMGWFFGLQNVWYPLLLTLIINASNILLSYWLVSSQGWGVAGVAYGTVGAQYLGALVGLILVISKYKHYFSRQEQPQLWNWSTILEPQAFQRFLNINSDIFIRTFCLTLVFGFFYSQSAVVGGTILAVNTILMQFLNWMSYGVDGFAYAAESLVGRYTGANAPKTTKKAIRLSLYWGMVLAVVFSLVYGLAGNSIVALFSQQDTVRSATLPYLPWLVVLPIIGTPCYIWDGIFVGLTAVKSMRNSMLIALVTFAVFYWGLRSVSTLNLSHALWFSIMVFLATRGLVQGWWYRQKGLDLT